MTTELPEAPTNTAAAAGDATTSPATSVKKRMSTPKIILVFVLVFAVMAGSWFAMQTFLTSSDQSATAAAGYEYSTDAYSVLFPEKPTVGSQPIPGTDVSLEMATWENKQKVYASTYSAVRDESATLDDLLAGSLSGSGATLVDSQPVDVDGGTAVIAQSTVEQGTMWTMVVLPDDGGFLMLLHSGDKKDDAFFDSLVIH